MKRKEFRKFKACYSVFEVQDMFGDEEINTDCMKDIDFAKVKECMTLAEKELENITINDLEVFQVGPTEWTDEIEERFKKCFPGLYLLSDVFTAILDAPYGPQWPKY